jgi:Rod binding domain-containing protein
MNILAAGSGPPTQAELADPTAARAWQAARAFEAMAIGQFLQPMFAIVDPSGGAFGGGTGEATWRPMLTDQIAHELAEHGGIGLAASVYRQMLRAQETP